MFGRGRSLSMTKYCGRENSLFDDPKFNDHKVLVVKGSIFWTLKTLFPIVAFEFLRLSCLNHAF